MLTAVVSTLVATETLQRFDEDSSYGPALVVALSLATTVATGIISFLNPVQRWQQLRAAQLELEAHAWKFRTRTGEYVMKRSSSRAAERELHATVARIRSSIIEAAAIGETDFFSQNPWCRRGVEYRHGQTADATWADEPRKSARADERRKSAHIELIDDHHCIVRPEQYVEIRLKRSISFYKSRIPAYYSKRTTLHLLGLASAGLMVVMGGVGLASFVAIVTVVSSSMTAWGEFHGFPKKLARYSSTVNELTALVLWWEHLTDVERNTTQKFEDLVHHVEDALATERKGWLTTSQAAKMLAKQLGSDSESDDRERTEKKQG